MKLFLAILLLAVTLASAEYVVKTREDLLKYREECVAELHVPNDHLEKYKKWEFPDDTTTHCYMKCVLEKFGLFNKDTGFDAEKVHIQMVGGNHADHTDDTHAKIEKCADKNTQGSDACLWAYRGAMCFIAEHLQLVKKSVHSNANHDHAHHDHEHHDHEHHDHEHHDHEHH